jgi:hypothetical protein
LRYGETADFTAARVPAKTASPEVLRRHDFFQRIRDLRERPGDDAAAVYAKLVEELFSQPSPDWLQAVELLELSYKISAQETARARLLKYLSFENFKSESVRQTVRDGVALAAESL